MAALNFLCCHAAALNSGKSVVRKKVEDLLLVAKKKATLPHISLQNGNWVKLICGASFEDLVDVRNLSLVYTLAGG